jgi:ATP-dependent exoDNAse (exonuclease V) alpha subunit
MLLRNLYDEDEKLIQANGETGAIQEINSKGILVMRDDGTPALVKMVTEDNGVRLPVKENGVTTTYVIREPTAEVVYMPLCQAWATTVHKAQGLTLNHPTMVDIFGNEGAGANFFGHPAMVYVAISRVKNPKDLTIVGANNISDSSRLGLTLLEAHCNMERRCKRWL